MDADYFLEQARMTALIVEAVHRARYALVVHHSLTVRSEGEEWRMDFSDQIDRLTEALELLGIDTSAGLEAPMRRGKEADR
jgi:hypothetical protein